LRDLDRVRSFLAPKDRNASRRAVSTIRQGVRMLAQHPSIGRPIEGYPSEYREWFIAFGNSGYVVRYRNEEDQITVLALRHGKETQSP
jgi:plasmid stabilization system protein ParE